MRTFLKRLVIPLLLIVIGFAGGSVFGFFNGLGAFVLIDATPRGALAVANLNALAAGKPESVKVLLEHEVDQSLAFYSLASEAWWFPLFQRGLFLTDPNNTERYIRRAATYRKHHPSLSREDMFDEVPKGKEQYQSEYKDLAVGIREHLQRVNDMVAKYAEK